MHTVCDHCSQPAKKVGKLFKVGYLYLCKNCRKKVKKKK